MMKDAEAHAEEDKKRRADIEIKNQLDSMIYNTEKTLNENKDKLEAADIGNLETALASAKKALEGADTEVMKKETETLTAASHKLAEAMYKASQTAQASGQATDASAGSAQAGAPKADDVIDAEFKDVN